MTREEELAQLIAEQREDNTHIVRPAHGSVEIDGLANFLSSDEEGNVICHLKPERGTVLQQPATGNEPWHGTQGGYTNHRCRCFRCRTAQREALRRYRDRS